jgi:hypothetical protein
MSQGFLAEQGTYAATFGTRPGVRPMPGKREHGHATLPELATAEVDSFDHGASTRITQQGDLQKHSIVNTFSFTCS